MMKVDRLLEIYKPGDMDILILPEMSFTGYVFHNKEEIEPYVEDEETGCSVLWAKKQAKRLECYVMVGYPQKISDKYYNSICFINPLGNLVYTYQKSFLYDTDENWANEGPGFVSMEIDALGKVGFGICMDINPYQFKAYFDEYEFGYYHQEQKTSLLLCSMAWIYGGNAMDTIEYWISRLKPLYKNTVKVVICNRTGVERGIEFAGASCGLAINKNRIIIKGLLEREEGVLMIEY